ncbi:MAG: M23 family peptidase, partial [Microbacterium sp.]
MAEQFDSSKEASDSETTPAERGRARRLLARRSAKSSALTGTAAATPRRAARPRTAHPVRSFLTVTAVAGMVATVAIPAFAAARGVGD